MNFVSTTSVPKAFWIVTMKFIFKYCVHYFVEVGYCYNCQTIRFLINYQRKDGLQSFGQKVIGNSSSAELPQIFQVVSIIKVSVLQMES